MKKYFPRKIFLLQKIFFTKNFFWKIFFTKNFFVARSGGIPEVFLSRMVYLLKCPPAVCATPAVFRILPDSTFNKLDIRDRKTPAVPETTQKNFQKKISEKKNFWSEKNFLRNRRLFLSRMSNLLKVLSGPEFSGRESTFNRLDIRDRKSLGIWISRRAPRNSENRVFHVLHSCRCYDTFPVELCSIDTAK